VGRGGTRRLTSGRLTKGTVVTALVVAAAVAGPGTEAGGAAVVPVVSQPKTVIAVAEGATGLTRVTLPVTLSHAAASTVQVGYTTLNNSATAAGLDYVPATGVLTFAPGVVSQSIIVSVRGDVTLEDYEFFRVRLQNPVGAKLGPKVRRVEIRNDERPVLVVNAAKTMEGGVAGFKTRLKQKYFQPLVVNAVTRDGTARAPSDYAPKSTAVSFAAGTKGPLMVNVATKGDALVETKETFSLNASAAGIAAAATATVADGPLVTPPPTTTTTTTATTRPTTTTTRPPTTAATTTTTRPPTTTTTTRAPTTTTTPPTSSACPAGSNPTTAQPAAPASPSSAATLLIPTGVRGSERWDLMFNDEFGDAAYTASKWSNGMRSGAQTLEANTELQWYLPANSALTTDSDGTSSLGVLRQTLKKEVVPNEMYTRRTLSRLYPPAQCASLYNSSTSATSATRTPFQFTSGMLNNSKSFGFKYGYIETRVKMPKGFALWPALWLRDWGSWGYEIDVFEGFDRQSRTIRTSYWWGNGSHRSTENDGGDIGLSVGGVPCKQFVPIPATSSSSSACSLANGVDLSAGYHTIGLNWTATKYELYLDGVKRWTSPAGADVADTYNHLILNLALGNNEYEFDWLQHPLRPLNPNLFSSSYFPKKTIEWDYVRVWQPANAHNVCTPPACN
jgi:beta-glucanase (GH16 family)